MFFGRRRADPASRPDSDEFTSEALALLDSLFGTALRLTRDSDRAQDLVQDTYLKALRARDRFAAGTNLKAWLFTILHNTWRNRQRDQARSRVEFDSEAVDEASESFGGPAATAPESPEALLLRANLDAELQAALDALPEAFRVAVWLRDVEELSYQEIAETLAIPLGTVMSRISRGRKQLHRLLIRSREADLAVLNRGGGSGAS
jgi:RNA polymerase sigma-70 factor (ECF subfamily)